MKTSRVLTGVTIFALLIVLIDFFRATIVKEKQASTQVLSNKHDNFHYFEKYTGVIDGKPTTLVILETAYVLANGERGNAKVGAINTARGFEQDEDATVYELDWKQAENSRQFFVRLTSVKNRIFKLDNSGKIIKDSFLSASGSTP